MADGDFSFDGWTLSRALEDVGFLERSAVAFVLTDAQGVVVDCSGRVRHVFGVERDEFLGSPIFADEWEVRDSAGQRVARLDLPHLAAMHTGEVVQNVPLNLVLPDGRRRWFGVNAYPLRVAGDVVGVVTTYLDHTETETHDHTMSMLTNVNHFVTLAVDEADAQRQLCHYLVEQAGYALAWIAVALPGDEHDVEFTFAAGETDYLQAGLITWSDSKASGLGPAGTCLRTGRVQVVDDLVSHSLFEPWRERARHFNLRSSVAVPFRPGGARACLSLYSRHAGAFPESVVRGLEAIAREMESGIAHIRSLNQVADALDGTLAALARITEARDPYTAGHQSKVGRLAAAIAAAMGIDEATTELIRRAGDVHDVGKTAIASEILTKPGRLTPLEYRMVQRHAQIGADILAQAKLPQPIVDVALQHHERMNGSGYPQALRGEEIILPARIVAVADVIEAMMNHRPYRSELGLERALEEVSSRAGELYDADVVRHCLATFDAGFSFGASVEFDLSQF